MHRPIKRFYQEGFIADDKDFVRCRNNLEKILIDKMRDGGYVRLLDLGPYWSTSWDGKKYKFLLSIQGVYVGKRQACAIEGITNEGFKVPISTKIK